MERASAAALLVHGADVAAGLKQRPLTAGDSSGESVPSPAVASSSLTMDTVPITDPVVTPVEVPAPVLPSSVLTPVAVPAAGGVEGSLGDLANVTTVASGSAASAGGRVLKGFDPDRSIEVIAKRDQFSKTFENPDGTETVQVSSVPLHFRDASGLWVNIDNRVVVGADGVLTNAGNSWHVKFQPMGPGAGVSMSGPDGDVRFVAAGASGVAPVVEPDGEGVRYRDVFPGSDLVYRVIPTGIEELLVVKSASARSTASFVFDGVTFADTASGLDALGDGVGKSLQVTEPITFDAKGKPLDSNRQVLDTANIGFGQSRVDLGIDSSLLKSLPSSSFPVVVDPNIDFIFGATWLHSYAQYTNTGGAYGSITDGYVRVGNPGIANTASNKNLSSVRWRSTAFFDYQKLYGADVVSASLSTAVVGGTTTGVQPLTAMHASPPESFNSANPATSPHYLDSSLSTGSAVLSSDALGGLYNGWTTTSTYGGVLLFSGSEVAGYTFKQFAVSLTLTVNRKPTIPVISSSSANGHTLTWGTAGSTDPDPGDTVYYNYEVRSGATAIWDSGWTTAKSISYKAPLAYVGQQLSFGVQAWDGVANIRGRSHTTDLSMATWTVGNLAPVAGALALPANGASLHPTSVTAPSVTFTANAGSDGDADPLQYAFFYCTSTACLGAGNPGLVWMQSWTTPTSATYSTSYSFPSSLWGTPLYWGVAVNDGKAWATSTSLASFTLVNSAPPQAATNPSPVDLGAPTSLTQTLSVSPVTDPNGDAVTYKFRICNDLANGVWVADQTKCIESGWLPSPSWTVPATNPLKWSATTSWWVLTSDGLSQTESGTKFRFVAQKTAATVAALGFGAQPNMRPVANVNTATGDLEFSARDLLVRSITTPLELVRSYNSLSTTVGGFGQGWTSTWEWSLASASDGVSVQQPDGRVLFFGRNGDGTFAPELGTNATLLAVATPVSAPFSGAAWQMTEHDLTVRYFSSTGAYLGFRDSANRAVTIAVVGNTQTITDTVSGRQIFIDWSATPGASTSRIVKARTVPIASNSNTAVEWHYYYDATNRLSQVCDPRNNTQDTGNCYAYAYDGSNRVVQATLPLKNTQITVTYGSDGKVATRADGIGNRWTYAYYTNVTFTNTKGETVVAARRTIVTDPRNNSEVFDFDSAVREVRFDNLAGAVLVSTYDVAGWIDKVSEVTPSSPTALTTDFNFQPDGDLGSEVDPVGQVTCSTFNGNNVDTSQMVGWQLDPSNPTNCLPPASGPSLQVVDCHPDSTDPGCPTVAKGASFTSGAVLPAGVKLDSTVLTSRTVPGQGTESWSYTAGSEAVVGQPGVTQPPSLVKLHTTADGRVESMSYNAAGDLVSMVTTTGTTVAGQSITYSTAFTYDEIGRQLSKTVTSSAGSVTTTFGYDALGDTVVETDPRFQNAVTGQWHQRRVSSTFDANTNLTVQVVADVEPAASGFSSDPARTTRYEYDLDDRLWRTTDSMGAQTSVGFDAVGNQVSSTDALGRVTVTDFDSENRPVKVTAKGYVDPTNPGAARDVVVSQTAYDGFGRVATETDALGHVVTTSYNGDGQVTAKTLKGFHLRSGGVTDVVLEAHTYDSTGQVTSDTAASGAVTSYTYNSNLLLVSKSTVNDSPAGVSPAVPSLRTTWYGYDAQGRVTSQVDTDSTAAVQWPSTGVACANAPAVVASCVENRTSFDAFGHVQSTVVENGATDLTTSNAYNDLGQLVSVTDPRGNVSSTSYDVLGRVIAQTSPQAIAESFGVAAATVAPVATYGYDTFGERTHSRDAAGLVTVAKFDGDGRQVGTVYPAYTPPGSVSPVTPSDAMVYDAAGNTVSTIDRRGQATDFVYDIFNRQAIRRDPAATVGAARGETWTRFDDAGSPVWTRDPVGAVTERVYDDLGRVRSMTSVVRNTTATPDRFTTTYDYNWAGQQILEIDPTNTTVQTAVYSPAGDMLQRVDALGNVTSLRYNVRDQVVSTTDAQGRSIRNTFDLAGRLTGTGSYDNSNPAVRMAGQSYGYDANGNRTTLTTSSGHTTTFSFDAANRLRSVTQPVDGATSLVTGFGYDTRGLRTKMVDARNNTWWTTYNPWGLEESRIEPATTAQPALTDRTFTRVYDAAGALVREDRPGGISISHTVDALGRVSADAAAGTATGSRSFTYDLDGRVTSAVSGSAAVQQSWTDRGQLAAVTGSAGASSFTYDAAGRVVQRSDVAGVTSYSWTPRGQVAGMVDPLTNSTHTFGYSAAGDLLTDSITDGVSTLQRSYGRDGMGRVTSDSVTSGVGTVVTSMTYAYDADGNLVNRVTAGVGSESFGYDWAGRLVSWTDPSGKVTGYGYDGAGNRVSAAGVVATFDERNRMLADGAGTVIGWSPAGTMSSRAVGGVSTLFAYDGLGRMMSAGSVVYTVDGFDRVVTRGGVSLSYSGASLQPTSDGTGVMSVLPDGTPVGSRSGSAGSVVVGNSHGDVVALTNTAGLVSDRWNYDPWGSTLTRTGVADVPVGFQSSFTDPVSGMVDMGARWYAPTQAGFTSEDSWAGDPIQPVSMDRFSYANDNPIGMWDTDGHRPAMPKQVAGTRAPASKSLPKSVPKPTEACPKKGCNADNDGGRAPCNRSDFADIMASRYSSCGESGSSKRRAMQDYLAWDGARSARPCNGVACDYMAGFIEAAASPVLMLRGMVKNPVKTLWSIATSVTPEAQIQQSVNCVRKVAKCAGKLTVAGIYAGAGASLSEGAADLASGELGVVCRHSFDSRTEVVLADGSRKHIADVKIGDQVRTTDPATGRAVVRKVTALHRNHDTDLADIIVTDGIGRKSMLRTTQHHPLWDDTSHGWVEAAALAQGDRLHTAEGGQATVESVHTFVGQQWMYDLTVDDVHTYYVVVGDEPVLVHNCGGLDATEAASGGALRGVNEVLDGLPKGDQSWVRMVPDESSLITKFNELTEGGTPTTWKNFDGAVIERGDGVQVGLRGTSSSGGGAVDIRMPDGSRIRIHVEQP